MMTSNQPLVAATERRTRPDEVHGDPRLEFPRGGASSAERAAAGVHFASKADRALSLVGLTAPKLEANERISDYRRRLLSLTQMHCALPDAALRKVEASTLPHTALPIFEKQIIGGAVKAFEAPVGPLRSCVRRDHANREVTHFFGDEQAAWLPFTNAVAIDGTMIGFKVGRIDASLCTGPNGPEARAYAAQAQARAEAGARALAAQERQRSLRRTRAQRRQGI